MAEDKAIQKKQNALLRQAAMKVFPMLKQERTQTFLIIILTLAAISMFGLFAINPTIVTIIQLKKQVADNKLVQNKLQQKITNLSILQGKYDQIQPALALVLAAVPSSPNITEFIGKVQGLAAKNNVKVIAIQSNPLTLTPNQTGKAASVPFSFSVQGAHNNVVTFIGAFFSFDRIVTIDAISVNTTVTDQGTATQALIQGKAIFQPLQ